MPREATEQSAWKEPLPEFDISRKTSWDPRDPRASPQQWPCFGAHTPDTVKSNRSAQWQHCQCCYLRLSYVPRKGSPATHMQTVNPATCVKMLAQLRVLMEGQMPTADICQAMMEKVLAEEKAMQKIEHHKSHPTSMKKKGDVINTSAYSPRASPSSNSWECVSPTKDPVMQDLETHLSEKEKAELLSMLETRKKEAAMGSNMEPELP